MLAATQTLLHLYYDYDRVVLPMSKLRAEGSTEKPTDVEPPAARLKRDAPVVLRSAVARAVATSILGPFIYALLVRPFAWPWSLYLARLFWSIPKDSAPPRFPPYHISLILRSATSGLLLLCLWDMSNAAFGAFVAQEPLKKGQPLTDDSRDPNGSLINGLKSKKEVPKVHLSTSSRNGSFTNKQSRLLLCGNYYTSAINSKREESLYFLKSIVQVGRLGRKLSKFVWIQSRVSMSASAISTIHLQLLVCQRNSPMNPSRLSHGCPRA